MSSTSQRRWATAGKLLAGLVAIGTLITISIAIYDRFSGPQISARIQMVQYDPDPQIRELFVEIREGLEPDKLKTELVKAYKDTKNADAIPEISDDIYELLSRRLKGPLIMVHDDFPITYHPSKRAALASIINHGNKPAMKVVLFVPGSGHALERRGLLARTPKTHKYEESIAFDVIRPGEELELVIIPDSIFLQDLKYWRLTYGNGIGTIYQGHVLGGPGPDLVMAIGPEKSGWVFGGGIVLLMLLSVYVYRRWMQRAGSQSR